MLKSGVFKAPQSSVSHRLARLINTPVVRMGFCQACDRNCFCCCKEQGVCQLSTCEVWTVSHLFTHVSVENFGFPNPKYHTVVIPLRQFGSRHPLRCYSKITLKERLIKMRNFEYVCFETASSNQQPLCCFAKTGIKSDFKCVFFTVIIKKCQLRFSHNYTVLSLINYPR